MKYSKPLRSCCLFRRRATIDVISSRSYSSETTPIKFDFSKVLILNKITRYEFEKKKNANLSEAELKEKLTKRGSNFERIVEHHNIHQRSLERILKALKDARIDTKITQRYSYTQQLIDWSNCVLTAGGDGTFLLASAKVNSIDKPVFGVNTDVTSSEGHLLLGKEQSINFSKTLNKLLNGKFKWLMRARIRVGLEGQHLNMQPIELHDQVLNNLEYRYIEHIEENRQTKIGSNKNATTTPEIQHQTIPSLALNEVFIGESLSARVSYYQMSIDDCPFFKQKSSGIIICTGTGSSSWCYNINKMSVQSIKRIIHLLNGKLKQTSVKIPENDKFVAVITNEFNDAIVFDPNQLRMAYTVRDPIINSLVEYIFQLYNLTKFKLYIKLYIKGYLITRQIEDSPRSVVLRRITVQSRCFDACLVIDGGQSYQFNDGARATLEIRPEDCLRTVLVDLKD